MGLDNYAMRGPEEELTDDDVAAFEAEAPNLCGGITSSDQGSFRGKVYSGLIVNITGESLYEHFIPPGHVKAMYTALRDCDPNKIDRCDYRFGEPEEQIEELRKFFKVCAERNLGIVGWW
jgi:hypothetical protein